jgi:hypothetical protein
MKTTEELEQEWTKKAEKLLLNKKIVSVRYLSTQEQEMLGWNSRCILMQLDDGTLIYPSRDDEGNDAGALFYENYKNEDYVLPVI